MSADVRPVWIGTSWKMTKTLAEATAFVDTLLASPAPAETVQAFVLPPHTALATVRDRLAAAHSPVLLGAQDAHWEDDGPRTGEVSMRQVADAGARIVEVGHSERRAAGETDEVVALKVAAALRQGLLPLVCVGEPASVRGDGGAASYVEAQLRSALALVTGPDAAAVLVAYEPQWAIGETGRAATADQVAPVASRLQRTLAELAGGRPARGVLYGGGVDRHNVDELLSTGVDGLFVGRAGWSAEGFVDLLRRAGAPRPDRVPTPC